MKKLILLLLALPMGSFANDAIDSIRADRVNACSQAFDEYAEHIEKKYIHLAQDPVLRCATYMHLVYAYESGFGTSNRCRNTNNCFGIKQMTNRGVVDWINHGIADNRFLRFDNKKDANLVFARLYFKFHMNKKISQFVYDWSMTDRWTYISFMRERFTDVYRIYEDMFRS